jgi:hypothetical protein
MQVYKEAVAIVMTPDERNEITENLGIVWHHLDQHLRSRGDIEAGSPDVALSDAMKTVADLCRRLQAAKYA